MSVATHQQQLYESTYEVVGNDFGFPDRRLTPNRKPKGARILTIGGGTANDLWFLAKENFVVNVEYAMSGLQAGARHGVRGIAADLNFQPTLPFSDYSFDLIVCKDILEHLINPLAVLLEARRVMREDGEIVISVPNHFYWPIRLRILLGMGLIWKGPLSNHAVEYHDWDYMHIRFFTYKGFRAFLAAGQLEPRHFYWDFGNLAYYYNPDRWFEPQIHKRAAGQSLSSKAEFALRIVRPLWQIFNMVFPRRLRAAIVQRSPGLLCAGFYVRCAKE